MPVIELTEETTVDALAKASRGDLNDTALHLEIEAPDKMKNKTQVAQAILEKHWDDAPPEARGGDEDEDEMPTEPKLANVRRWYVKESIQYIGNRGKKKVVARTAADKKDPIIDDIPNASAQDLFRRGCLEPVLR